MMKLIFILLFLNLNLSADQVIVYERPDGGTAVVHPAPNTPIGVVLNKDVPAGTRFKIIQIESLPSDRSQRDNWAFSPNASNGISISTRTFSNSLK